MKFDTIFLGGAPAWPALLDRARAASLRLAPTYGMTETASQIITLHPKDFLRGQSGCGKRLPHARVDWAQTQPLGGRLRVQARSLALGYYRIEPATASSVEAARTAIATHPTSRYGGRLELWGQGSNADGSGPSLVTDDLGYCDDQGYFHILGRASDKIISGGENVFPAAVEAAILATGLVRDAVVIGLADADWGERVVAVVAAEITGHFTADVTAKITADIAAAIAPWLTPAQRPKQWLMLDKLPRNAQGKIQRQAVRDWALAQSQSP